MKSICLSLFFIIIIMGCKSDKTIKKPLTIAEKIANAHGYENWKNVSEVKFTFKVDRDTIKGKGRSWVWQPRKNQVKMTFGNKVFDYSRDKIDQENLAADKAFINDKFWFLVPFQLVWDSSATISKPKKAESPIQKEQLNTITILYENKGGYTPGDAYDIFYDDNYLIKEWVFRKGNSNEASLTTTFENYKDYNGIKIAIDHKKEDGLWNLNFSDVSIAIK